MIETRLAERARQLSQTIVAHQRALHRIPELAFEERETSGYLERTLRDLGLAPRRIAGGTGLIVELPGSGDGPTILLRADIDALPIAEDATHEIRSDNAGRMHACGHDGHMAVALGAAASVCDVANDGGQLPGRLVVLFQPAEEVGAGAARVVQEGVLDECGVDAVVGLHLWSFLERGRAIVPPETVMASADEFRVVLTGRGGHGALPHEANDVVLALSHLVVALQSLVSREIDPVQPAVLTVGRVQAGTATNVLPVRAELEGTFRAPNTAIRGHLLHRVGEMAQAIGLAHSVEAQVEFGAGIPPTVNDPACAAVLRAAASDVLGADLVAAGPPVMAAEDFGILLQSRPGAFMLLGMRDESVGAVHAHHHPSFRIVPDVLPVGSEILLRAAIAMMREGVEAAR